MSCTKSHDVLLFGYGAGKGVKLYYFWLKGRIKKITNPRMFDRLARTVQWLFLKSDTKGCGSSTRDRVVSNSRDVCKPIR